MAEKTTQTSDLKSKFGMPLAFFGGISRRQSTEKLSSGLYFCAIFQAHLKSAINSLSKRATDLRTIRTHTPKTTYSLCLRTRAGAKLPLRLILPR